MTDKSFPRHTTAIEHRKPEVHVRLLRRGEGTAAMAVAAAAGAPGVTDGAPPHTALDQAGGRIAFPELPGGSGLALLRAHAWSVCSMRARRWSSSGRFARNTATL